MDAARNDRTLFERLCLLRELYARRGEQDRGGVISLTDAMRFAEARLAEPRQASAASGS